MAGVGLELSKLLSKPGYSSVFKAYGLAGLLGSGPWLVAVLSLGILGMLLTEFAAQSGIRLLFTSITFIYGLTLILTGPVQLILARYAADQKFIGRDENIRPAFVISLAGTTAAFAALGSALFLGFVKAPPLFQLSAAALMAIVGPIWITVVFLTSVKNYYSALSSFAAGFLVTLAAGWALGWRNGASGAMFGVTLGHGVLLLLLCRTVFRENAGGSAAAFGYAACFIQHWDLALCGLFYNLGIWIDKFLYWWADPGAQRVNGILFTSPIFDRVVYISFLSVVPGMAVFLLKLETELSVRNQAFFDRVLKKAPFEELIEAKQALIRSSRRSFLLLLKVQGLTAGLLILLSGSMLKLLGLGAEQASILHVSLLGVFMLMMFLSVLTNLYYLDQSRPALYCCLVFVLLNAGVTLLSISGGERWFGFGLLVAAGASLALAAALSNRLLENLDYHTFASP